MREKVIKILMIGLITTNACFSQTGISNPAINLFEHSPSAPNSSSLGKYFDHPVNMSTGVPNIEIPLFTIKSGNITIPITLKYHASGIRVNENASWVGMGWSVEVGGVITKRVNGADDFYPVVNNGMQSTYLNPDFSAYSSYFTTVTDAIESPGIGDYMTRNAIDWQHFMGRIPQGRFDGEADEFIFSTPENGGKFFYNQKLHQFTLDKKNGWKIIGTPNLNPNTYIVGGEGNWDLMSNSGVLYSFGNIEKYANPSGSATGPTYLVNSWYLTSISDNVKNKSVSFNYDEIWSNSGGGHDLAKDFGANGPNNYYIASSSDQNNQRYGTELSISGIGFDEGSVLFIKDPSARLDGAIKALKEIQIRNASGQVIKRYLFNQFYTNPDPGTSFPSGVNKQLFLQSVQEISINSNGDTLKNPPYSFTYNLDRQMPCRFSYAQDHWGYYNGKKSNTTLLPNDEYNNYGLTYLGPGADRNIDTAYTKTGIIKELYYPTGGKTIFEFENNTTSPGHLVGGLRAKRITNYDNVNNASLVTEYVYGSGEQLYNPASSYMYLHTSNSVGGSIVTSPYVRIEGQSLYPLFCSQGSPVLYTDVTQKQKGIGTEELISEHHFVNLGQLDNWQNESNGVPHNKYAYYDNFNGQEYATEYYKKNADGSTSLVQQNSTDIEPLNNFKNYFWNVQGAWVYPGSGEWAGGLFADPYQGGETQPLLLGVNINAYKMMQEQAVTKKKQQIKYNGSQTIKEESFYDYDLTNGNNKLVRMVNSAGDTLINRTKFVSDYADYGLATGDWNAGISTLLNANISSYPVETVSFLKKKNQPDSILLSATLIKYQNLTTKQVYKLKIAAPITNFQLSYNSTGGFFYDNRYELFQEVTARDFNNNPLTVSQNSQKQSYIWGYNNQYPVAQAINAANNEIFFDGFDEGSGWDGSLTAYDKNFKHSGNASGRIDKGSNGELYSHSTKWLNISLSTPTKYKYSGWVYSNGPTVEIFFFMKRAGEPGYFSYVDNVFTNATNKWVYLEKEYTVPADVTQLNMRVDNNGGGTVWFDDIRLYPAAAQMTTYTYDPLVGMTSQCDANGRFTYYEYDAFQRLVVVRDQDNNILKKICYNYAGQPENCITPTYTNDQQQATFTSRAFCAAGLIAPSTTYTIPAGTFTSLVNKATANQLAANALATNGQGAADALPCLAPFNAWNKTTTPWSMTITNTAGTFNNTYSFYPGSSVSLFANIPVGTYNISLVPMYAGSVTSPVQFLLNGNTYSGTSFNLTGISVTAATTITLQNPPASGPCSFTVASGYSSPTSSITNNGIGANGYFVFYPSSTMTQGNNYFVATVNGACRPSGVRTFSATGSGRNWTVTVYPSGEMYVQMAYGSASLSPYSTVSVTISYNL